MRKYCKTLYRSVYWHTGRLFRAKQIPVEPVQAPVTPPKAGAGGNLKAPRAAPVRIYTNAEDLVGKPFTDLGGLAANHRATNQDSPPYFYSNCAQRMQTNASGNESQRRPAAQLWEITSGTPGCYRPAVCIGSP
ncbi:Rcs stress response system protein RcsF [Salmonella enterica subsp. enterica]|nr:Rcs stress response system protein RcsF [Salmonella enterica subsp. enterica]